VESYLARSTTLTCARRTMVSLQYFWRILTRHKRRIVHTCGYLAKPIGHIEWAQLHWVTHITVGQLVNNPLLQWGNPLGPHTG
jgi:hypothetical protein